MLQLQRRKHLDIAEIIGTEKVLQSIAPRSCRQSRDRLRIIVAICAALSSSMQAEPSDTAEASQCPPRVIRCERVLRKRTKSVLLVLDRITDPHNEAAAHRCAEALGVQHVWTVAPPLQPVKKRPKRDTKSVAKGADGWLSLQRFDNVASCVSALRVEGWDIWCAADGAGAVELGSERPPELTPAKVAVVIGADAASSKVST